MLEKAIYADANGSIAQALAFDIKNPRAALTELYLSTGQLRPALALGPDVEDREQEIYSGDEEARSDDSEDYEFQSFKYKEPADDIDANRYLTLSETAVTRARVDRLALFGALTDAAIKVGDLNHAINLLTAYQKQLTNHEQIAVAQQRIEQLNAQLTAKQAEQNPALRLDSAMAESALAAISIQNTGF